MNGQNWMKFFHDLLPILPRFAPKSSYVSREDVVYVCLSYVCFRVFRRVYTHALHIVRMYIHYIYMLYSIFNVQGPAKRYFGNFFLGISVNFDPNLASQVVIFSKWRNLARKQDFLTNDSSKMCYGTRSLCLTYF